MEFKVGDKIDSNGLVGVVVSTSYNVCLDSQPDILMKILDGDLNSGNPLDYVQSNYPYLVNKELQRLDNRNTDRYWVLRSSSSNIVLFRKYSKNTIINIRRNKEILSYRIVCFYKRVGSEDFYLTECVQGYNGNPIGYFSSSIQVLYTESCYNTIRKNPIFRVLSDVELGASIKLEKSTDRECYKAVSQTEEEFTLKTKSKKSHINFETL